MFNFVGDQLTKLRVQCYVTAALLKKKQQLEKEQLLRREIEQRQREIERRQRIIENFQVQNSQLDEEFIRQNQLECEQEDKGCEEEEEMSDDNETEEEEKQEITNEDDDNDNLPHGNINKK
jgi:hypothetical protein